MSAADQARSVHPTQNRPYTGKPFVYRFTHKQMIASARMHDDVVHGMHDTREGWKFLTLVFMGCRTRRE